jgi:hypothetical protein
MRLQLYLLDALILNRGNCDTLHIIAFRIADHTSSFVDCWFKPDYQIQNN